MILPTEPRLALQVQQGFPLIKAQLATTGPIHHLQKPTLSHIMALFLKETSQPLGQIDYFGSLPQGVCVWQWSRSSFFPELIQTLIMSLPFLFTVPPAAPSFKSLQNGRLLMWYPTQYCLKPMDPCYCKGVVHDHENHWSHHIPHHSEADSLMNSPLKAQLTF